MQVLLHKRHKNPMQSDVNLRADEAGSLMSQYHDLKVDLSPKQSGQLKQSNGSLCSQLKD